MWTRFSKAGPPGMDEEFVESVESVERAKKYRKMPGATDGRAQSRVRALKAQASARRNVKRLARQAAALSGSDSGSEGETETDTEYGSDVSSDGLGLEGGWSDGEEGRGALYGVVHTDEGSDPLGLLTGDEGWVEAEDDLVSPLENEIALSQSVHALVGAPGDEGEGEEGMGGVENPVARANQRRRDQRERLDFTRLIMMGEPIGAFEEHLVGPDSDFPAAWHAVPIPEGERRLLVSSRGRTFARNRAGDVVAKFVSRLPSGSPRRNTDGNKYCILDTVYVPGAEGSGDPGSYYVLDLLCWKGHPLLDTTAEFRTFWRITRLAECAGVDVLDEDENMHPIHLLPSLPCADLNALAEATASTLPPTLTLAGLLFFHSQGHYTPPSSPLVLWADLSSLQALFS